MIQEFENSLRYIISFIIGDSDEAEFGVEPRRLKEWRRKREKEKRENNGNLIEPRILFFSDLSDLKTIVINNWDKFENVFHDKDKFQILFDEVKALRNAISHSRDLLPYQEHFLLFAVGDLKTKIINYHNRNMKIDDYFIRIQNVSDSMGHSWTNPDPHASGYKPDSILRVGDRIEFVIDAYDPKGREIEYKLSCGKTRLKNNDGRFVIDISNDMIDRLALFHITVSTEETDYKNEFPFNVFYTILP